MLDAARIMQRLDTGFVLVGENDRLVGTVTDRDIVINGVAAGKPADTPVSDVMSHDIYYCFDDQDPEEVAENMGELRVRRMPVLDRDKRLVGVVSLGDLSSRGARFAAGGALQDISE
jgi:CBS domain-containing protein